MRGLLLLLGCISLAQLTWALPSPGETRPSSTSGLGAASSSALKADGSAPAPSRASDQVASHHGNSLNTHAQSTPDPGGPRGGSSSGSNENNKGGGGHGDEGGQGGSQSIPTPARGLLRQPRRRKRRGHKPRVRGERKPSALCDGNLQALGKSTPQPRKEKKVVEEDTTPKNHPLHAYCDGNLHSFGKGICRPRRQEQIFEEDIIPTSNPLHALLRLTYPIVPPPSRAPSRDHHGEEAEETKAVQDTPVNSELSTTRRPLRPGRQLTEEEIKLLGLYYPKPSSRDYTESPINTDPKPSASLRSGEGYFSLTPEGVFETAQKLAARAGYAGIGALSSCAEKHSPYFLDGYVLPEFLVASNDSVRQHIIPTSAASSLGKVGKTLIGLAGREITSELQQARILTRAQAQLKQNCIDLLCLPKEHLLRRAEAKLNRAFRKGQLLSDAQAPEGAPEVKMFTQKELDEGYAEVMASHVERSSKPGTLLWLLSQEGTRWGMEMVKAHSAAWKMTPSEVDYAYLRFYEYAADYNFDVAMTGFLYNLRPDPRKGLPGEHALASSAVLRMLAAVRGDRLAEMKKQSLLSFQMGHIKFMRQLLQEKRHILAELLMPQPPNSEFPASDTPEVVPVEEPAKPRKRRAARRDKKAID